ncbi:hypothetical protein A9C19_05420 [Bacillus weihaiensis]|uniref:Fimbrial protein n=2 Tax=Bacillus weihaiensis TaxID=1547283 RepID=A0A1L3MPE8_9BACI|nr:hypothetical protein A9C19_05420 [Bacillus weihaiensis]
MMLAEINLLPQKQQRNYTNFLVIFIVIFILIAASVTLYIMINQKNSELSDLEQQVTQAQKQTEVLQQQAVTSDSTNAVAELENAVTWSEKYPVDFVPLLQETTRILPEKGFFASLDYVNSSSLHLVIQFESSREAAFYLNRLKDLEVIQDVKLTTIETIQLSEEEIDVVPRYLATYQLTVNRDVLKLIAEEGTEE